MAEKNSILHSKGAKKYRFLSRFCNLKFLVFHFVEMSEDNEKVE